MVQFGPPPEVYLFPADRDTASLLGDAILLPAHLGDGWVDCALGRIPARISGPRQGTGEIMLRPEQVRLVPEASSGHQLRSIGMPRGRHGRGVGGSVWRRYAKSQGEHKGRKPALAQANVAERLFKTLGPRPWTHPLRGPRSASSSSVKPTCFRLIAHRSNSGRAARTARGSD